MQVSWQLLMPAYGHLRPAVDTRTGDTLRGLAARLWSNSLP
jgi:hypothetical protein